MKSVAQVEQESMKAKEIMIHIMQSGQKYFIWSYETFMYLGQAYLDQLYKFLAIDSDFCPDLEDANRNRITKGKLKAKPRVLFRWRMIRKRIRSFFMRNIGVREEGPSIL